MSAGPIEGILDAGAAAMLAAVEEVTGLRYDPKRMAYVVPASTFGAERLTEAYRRQLIGGG